MEAAELMRYARRRASASQRSFALSLDVSPRTVARAEAGQVRPSFELVSRALALTGVELVPEPVVEAPSALVRGYLRHSLTRRLYHALGGRHIVAAHDRRTPAWRELCAVAGSCEPGLELTGPSALAVWLPDVPPPNVVGGELRHPLASLTCFDLVPRIGITGGVVVPLPHGRRVVVPSPVDLSSDSRCAAHRRALLGVARVLDEQAARDGAGRRAPAHKDPRHAVEREQVFHTKALHRYRMPREDDPRSWRLDDVVGLDAWLWRQGLPGRPPDR